MKSMEGKFSMVGFKLSLMNCKLLCTLFNFIELQANMKKSLDEIDGNDDDDEF